MWRCPECGDVMPPGFGEDDHFNCNYPSEFGTPTPATGEDKDND